MSSSQDATEVSAPTGSFTSWPGNNGIDAFIGATLQMDVDANSSTVTTGRLAGFGGAPKMGHDPHGRRHTSKPWLDLKIDPSPVARG